MWKLSLRSLPIGALWLILAETALAGPVESPSVKETNYPIPRGALFVALQGSDKNPGTLLRPLRTVSAAFGAASDGGTIIIRHGTYRESLPDLTKKLTLQPYPQETVWLKGSDIVSGWVAAGPVWMKPGWVSRFCTNCFHPANIDPDFPNAGLPEQVFVDGMPLSQVTSRLAMTTGTFYVDAKLGRLFIASDPRGRTVEVSVRGTALNIEEGGQGTVIRGLGFAHYSPVAEPGLGGTVKGNVAGLTFENNTFAWSAVKGLVVFAPDAEVRGNTFLNNGMMGLGAWKADGLRVTGNRFAFNNQERFAQTGHVSEAAGAKLTRTQGLTVTDNLFEGNYSSGLWLDIDVRNVIIARNVFKENRRHGLFYEISSNGIIASNIALRNGVAGIALSNATHMQVYNNTLFGNAISFLVQADKRMKQMLSKTQLDNGRISSETVFYNNLLAAADRTSKPYIWVRDFSSALNAGQLLSASDFNGFFRRNGYKPTGMVEWWQGGKQHLYKKLSDYQSSAGRDLNSVVLVKEPIDTFVSTRPNTSYAIAPGSFARSAGRNLPPDVAQAIGITNQRSPNLGALSLPGGIAITP